MGIKVSDLFNCATCMYMSKRPSGLGYTSECVSNDKNTKELFKQKGLIAAKKCKHYKCRYTDEDDYEYETSDTNTNIPIDMEDALDILLDGGTKFILHSTKTDEDFIYKIDKKEIPDGNYLYFVHILEQKGFEYAGNMSFLKSSNTYTYRQGKSGNYSCADLKIKSLLFVLNNLKKQNYDMKLQIYKVVD